MVTYCNLMDLMAWMLMLQKYIKLWIILLFNLVFLIFLKHNIIGQNSYFYAFSE